MSEQQNRVILHVDMDAFFASVELLRHPELRGLPVVVGGTGKRGVVAAASYEARSYGIHSAMPSVRAVRLCPDAVFLAGDHRHYSEVSTTIMDLFRDVTPLVEPLSLDEAFLDLSGTERSLGLPIETAMRLRGRVKEETGLSCSLGLARNKFLAKLATGNAKPRVSRSGPVEGVGVFQLDAAGEREFLDRLPIRRLWGVGPATLEKLSPLRIETVGDLARTDLGLLGGAIGAGAASRLGDLARGIDDRPVQPESEPKSISNEETFAADLRSMDALRVAVVRQSESVAARLRSQGYRGRTVQLKLRYRDFTTVTRSQTIDGPTDRGTDLVSIVWSMLLRLPVERGVRLIGVGVTNLTRDEVREQLSFDEILKDLSETEASGHSWDEANSAVDKIRSRFGTEMIGPARLAGRLPAPGEHQWGPNADPAAAESHRGKDSPVDET